MADADFADRYTTLGGDVYLDEVVLRHGVQANLPAASLSAFNAYLHPDGTVQVKLAVHGASEFKKWINIGETFSVGDQTWKLDWVEGAGEENWKVYLGRVG